jgi:hypothetical protein
VTTPEAMEDYLDAYVAGVGYCRERSNPIQGQRQAMAAPAGMVTLSRAGKRAAGSRRNPSNASAISPMRQPIQHSVAGACRLPSFAGAYTMPEPPGPTWGRPGFQRRRSILDQPSQHGACRHAPAIRSIKVDANFFGGHDLGSMKTPPRAGVFDC